jgi:hypothetical protein
MRFFKKIEKFHFWSIFANFRHILWSTNHVLKKVGRGRDHDLFIFWYFLNLHALGYLKPVCEHFWVNKSLSMMWLGRFEGNFYQIAKQWWPTSSPDSTHWTETFFWQILADFVFICNTILRNKMHFSIVFCIRNHIIPTKVGKIMFSISAIFSFRPVCGFGKLFEKLFSINYCWISERLPYAVLVYR